MVTILWQAIRKPEELYEDVVEVEERLVMCREDCRLNGRHPVVIATTGEKVTELLLTLS